MRLEPRRGDTPLKQNAPARCFTAVLLMASVPACNVVNGDLFWALTGWNPKNDRTEDNFIITYVNLI